MVPVQFFQSVIAVELAIVGALLWQIRFFDKEDNRSSCSWPCVDVDAACFQEPEGDSSTSIKLWAG
jgi:hypothetical protein